MNIKTILTFISLILYTQTAFPWGSIGHKDIVALSERHLTPQAKIIVENLFHHPLQEEATWMDQHRTNEWAFTNSWHVFHTGKDSYYDPDPTLAIDKSTGTTTEKGDALKAIIRAVYTLSDYKNLDDSTLMINIRYLVHYVGDMHCPVHVLIPGRTAKYSSIIDDREFYPSVGLKVPVWCNGREFKSFHTLYDAMPALLFPDKTPDEVAEILDTKKKKEIKAIIGQYSMEQYDNRYECTIPLYRWAHESALASREIWKHNPEVVYQLNPNTVELSKEMVENQMRNAGYRLAWILNTLLK